MTIKENIENVNLKIASACERSGRPQSDVKLIAVSKQHPVESIKEALDFGVTRFGENRSNELKEKASNDFNVEWHFIGHLQTNKVKDVVPYAHLIHSVDTEKLAKEIDKRAKQNNKIQKILIEANTGGEESKYGLVEFDEIIRLAEICKSLENVDLIGLMTMAPYTTEENIIRECFGKLKGYFDKLNQVGFNLTELSMGMTNDYEIAIEEGATLLRIGTAIFGSRHYGN